MIEKNMETNIGDLINRLIDTKKHIDHVKSAYEEEWGKKDVDRFWVEAYANMIKWAEKQKENIIKEINELWKKKK